VLFGIPLMMGSPIVYVGKTDANSGHERNATRAMTAVIRSRQKYDWELTVSNMLHHVLQFLLSSNSCGTHLPDLPAPRIATWVPPAIRARMPVTSPIAAIVNPEMAATSLAASPRLSSCFLSSRSCRSISFFRSRFALLISSRQSSSLLQLSASNLSIFPATHYHSSAFPTSNHRCPCSTSPASLQS
jgi:hypothetical protein